MTARNIAEALRRQSERSGARTAVRFKRGGKYHDLTWADYRTGAVECAAGLIAAGIQPGDRVGLLGENSVEWMMADLGILTAGGVTVSPHSSLSARQVLYQMKDSGARWLFVSTAAQLEKARQVCSEWPNLLGVVAFDRAANASDATSWPRFLEQGRGKLADMAAEIAAREQAIGPNHLATIMYTSGTTGDPKGVMLTHSNLLSNAAACIESMPLEPDDLVLCWLPLSHIYARTVDFYEPILTGTTVCLAESPETVVANIAEVQPTHVSCVPRFYEKLLAAIGTPDPAATAERLRKAFGPRIKFLGAGGAPLPRPLAKLLIDAGLPVYPGYGLTESSPVITFNLPGRSRLGTVGVAIPGVEVRIAEDGEVLCRGPNVMPGYWNNPEATADTVRDGWLHTGDLGTLDADGFLTITGRKKELLVLSSGKKVVPSYIEGLLVADDCIDQAAVYGEGRHFLTSIVVPHWANVAKTITDAGGPNVSSLPDDERGRHPAVCALLQRRIAERLADVASYEQVKRFVVVPRPFSVEADEITVSLKLRRNVVFAHHQAELEALYRE